MTRQPELINEWGCQFFGRAETITGHTWWYEDARGKRRGLLPRAVETWPSRGKRDNMPKLVFEARTPALAELIQDCADGKLSFDGLCAKVSAMGYRTTSLFEMVVAAEREPGEEG